MSMVKEAVVNAEARASEPHVERLDWDSTFFGARMGRIVRGEAGPAVTAATLDRARTDGFDHVILRVMAGDFSGIRDAETTGMSLVDMAIDFARPAGEIEREALVLRDASPDHLPWARDLGGRAFVHSRFYSDPFFSPEQGMAFHRQWVTNLWNGLASFVLVAAVEDRNAGFICCGQDGNEGRIVLITTDERVRGRGVGRALVSGALERMAASGVETARVKTQAANIGALNLYERCGFMIAASELTYSWSRNEGQKR
jgi:ribosomal protein S18 acetylase RimI-like enzyme